MAEITNGIGSMKIDLEVEESKSGADFDIVQRYKETASRK